MAAAGLFIPDADYRIHIAYNRYNYAIRMHCGEKCMCELAHTIDRFESVEKKDTFFTCAE